MDDKTLQGKLDALRGGDKEALSEIYEELKTPVHTIAYRILYDSALAEDVVHDIFVKLYQKPPSPQVRSPRAWIFRMTHNLAVDYKRRPAVEALDETAVPPCSPVEAAIEAQLDIEAAMRALAVDERSIVSLHLTAGLKFREVAEMLEMPLGTVLWKYQKAITELRDLLSGGAI